MITVYEVVSNNEVLKVFRTRLAALRYREQLINKASTEERKRVVAWIRETKYSG